MDLLKQIYSISPEFIQNVMVSARGLLFNRKRLDLNLAGRFLSELRESQWWSAERFQDHQAAVLNEHLKYACENVPYYATMFKKEGIDPDRIKSPQDLKIIPILEKTAVRTRPMEFLVGGAPDRSWNAFFTSGTTGSPMNLWSSKESFTRIWSFVFRLREWAGLSDPIFPRRVQFTGREIVPAKKAGDCAYWRHNFFNNALLFSTTHVSADTAASYLRRIREFRPELIDGYPSAILTLMRIGKSLNLEFTTPRAIITSAETLFEDERVELGLTFGCKAYNQYASSDTAAFISSCEFGNLHIHPEFGICEILKNDGAPAGPGEEGEIVATAFGNKEQVFIRYRVGDRAVAGPNEPCPCGRHMPRVESVTGRVEDIFYIPDRGYVGRFDPVFKGVDGILEAQIIHVELDLLKVRLVPLPTYGRDTESKLISNLRQKVGESITIEIEKTNFVERGPNGKFRAVYSMCRDKYPKL
jgi:phenylacetate-CoA ligase